jgi:aryl-alcohol dehydrogenase-like predicted oxidoreductase
MTDGDAVRTVRHAWDRGIRYFDTAPHYGLGLSERRLGSELSRHPRDEFVISTKVWPPHRAETHTTRHGTTMNSPRSSKKASST